MTKPTYNYRYKWVLSTLVREMRLELTRRLSHAPQTCLSTYSSTLANMNLDCLIIIRISSSFVNRFLSALRRNIFFLRNRVHSAIILMYFAYRLGGVLCAKIFCAGSPARRNCASHHRADFRAYPSSAAKAWK